MPVKAGVVEGVTGSICPFIAGIALVCVSLTTQPSDMLGSALFSCVMDLAPTGQIAVLKISREFSAPMALVFVRVLREEALATRRALQAPNDLDHGVILCF